MKHKLNTENERIKLVHVRSKKRGSREMFVRFAAKSNSIGKSPQSPKACWNGQGAAKHSSSDPVRSGVGSSQVQATG